MILNGASNLGQFRRWLRQAAVNVVASTSPISLSGHLEIASSFEPELCLEDRFLALKSIQAERRSLNWIAAIGAAR